MIPELPKMVATNIENFTGRTWLLPYILKWLDQSNDRMFILQGKPGSGKSTIIAWLAGAGPSPADANARSQLERIRSRIGATHFCDAASGNTDPRTFAKDMAEQLTRNVKGFSDALKVTLADRIQINIEQIIGTVHTGSIVTGIDIRQLNLGKLGGEESFNRALRDPLKELYARGYHEPMLLLVDALNEALTYTDSINIVHLLAKLADLPDSIRVMVTTRPDRQVLHLYNKFKPFDIISDAPTDENDVRFYVYERLAALNDKQRDLLADRISQASEGIFLYAHMVLGDSDLMMRLSGISDLAVTPLPKGLSGLYTDFLNRELGKDIIQWLDIREPVLGLIVVAQGAGLSRVQIENIIGKDVRTTLEISKQYLDGDLPDGPFRPFHKSFTDFLLDDKENIYYHIDATRIHRQIADYYWKLYNANWNDCDSYGLRYLAIHLRLAKEHEKLFELMNDLTWYNAKIAIDPSGSFYSMDLANAWGAAGDLNVEESKHGRLATYLGHEVRYALAIISNSSILQEIPPTLLKALVMNKQWEPTHALEAARQILDPIKKVHALCAIVPLLPEDLQPGVLQEGLAATKKIYLNSWPQIEARMKIASLMPELERPRVQCETFDSVLKIDSEGQRTDTLAWVAPILPEYILTEALEAIQRIENTENQEKVLVALISFLPERLLCQALHTYKIEYCRPAILAARVPYLKEAKRLPALRKALDEAWVIDDKYWKARAVIALIPHLPKPMLSEVLENMHKFSFLDHQHDDILTSLVHRLTGLGDVEGALAAIQSMSIEWKKAKALSTVASRLLSRSQLEQAFTTARTIREPYWKAEALGALVPYLSPENKRLPVFQEALGERKIDDADERTLALAALAIYLPDAMWREAFAAIQTIEDDSMRSKALVILAPRLPEDLSDEAIEIVFNMDKYKALEQGMVALATYLPENRLQTILNNIRLFEHFGENTSEDAPLQVLLALIPRLPEQLLSEIIIAARSLRHGSHKARALAAIVPRLPKEEQPAVLAEAFTAARQESEGILDDKLLVALASYLDEEKFNKVFEEILDLAQSPFHSVHYEEQMVKALVSLAPHLSEAMLPHALGIAKKLNQWAGIQALAALAPRLQEDPLREMLDFALNFRMKIRDFSNLSDDLKVDMLVQLHVPLLSYLLSEEDKLAVLNQVFEVTKEIRGFRPRVQVLAALSSYILSDIAAARPLGQLYILWRDTFRLHMVEELESRKDLLGYLCKLVPFIFALGGVEAVKETYSAIQEVGQRWHSHL